MNGFEKYKTEVQKKWGQSDAYKEFSNRTKNYKDLQWNNLAQGMDNIMAEFAVCVTNSKMPDSDDIQNLVKTLQNHITENYYLCTNEILVCLGRMYVHDERFKKNIDKHADGTAEFICKAIERYNIK